MDRFFINKPLNENHPLILENPEIARQLKKVLRKKHGDTIVLFNNSGFDFEFAIERIENKKIAGQITKRFLSNTEPEIKLHLSQGILKKDKMEWIFQKGTEIGVSEFTPILCSRSVKTELNLKRAEKIIIEATEQCGGVKVPKINGIIGFEEAARKCAAEKNVFNIIADKQESRLCGGISKNEAPRGSAARYQAEFFRSRIPSFEELFSSSCLLRLPPAKTLATTHGRSSRFGYEGRASPQQAARYSAKENKSIQNINLFIGPEGGFSNEEIELAKKRGFFIVSLGPRTLRAETAAIAASFLLIKY